MTPGRLWIAALAVFTLIAAGVVDATRAPALVEAPATVTGRCTRTVPVEHPVRNRGSHPGPPVTWRTLAR